MEGEILSTTKKYSDINKNKAVSETSIPAEGVKKGNK
jgi:hypothetical protein